MQAKIFNSDFQNYHPTQKNMQKNQTLPSSYCGSRDIYTWK